MIRAASDAGRKAARPSSSGCFGRSGLEVDDVTILDSTGQLLASGDDAGISSLSRSMTAVQSVQQGNGEQHRQGAGTIPGHG